jgi:hypothetical protein
MAVDPRLVILLLGLSCRPCAERVPGTEWLEVVCEDGRRYYHKPGSGETTWHMPAEVESKRRLRLDPAKARMLERARAMGAQVAPEYREGGRKEWQDHYAGRPVSTAYPAPAEKRPPRGIAMNSRVMCYPLVMQVESALERLRMRTM